MVFIAPTDKIVPIVTVASLVFLAVLGGIGALAGGADPQKGIMPVTFWGAIAMAVTAGIGILFGAII